MNGVSGVSASAPSAPPPGWTLRPKLPERIPWLSALRVYEHNSTPQPLSRRPTHGNRNATTLLPTTPDQQTAALDVLIRAALTNEEGPLTSDLQRMLGTVQHEAGLRVATVLVMLAGLAVPDNEEWVALLKEHLAGATPAKV